MTLERDPYQVLQISRHASWPEIRAAYRMLARRYHPDGTTPDTGRIIEINGAYECLERELGRRGDAPTTGVPVGPGRQADSAAPSVGRPHLGPLMRRMADARRTESPVIDFGQYAGWRLADVARHDPAYLQWLSRHSSGVRYRAVIEQLLGSNEIGRRAAVVR